jgi:hypothetical protein
MSKEEINALLSQLKEGAISELHVSKEDFLAVREVLVERDDFKHFHGVAERGGGVMYRYMENARS